MYPILLRDFYFRLERFALHLQLFILRPFPAMYIPKHLLLITRVRHVENLWPPNIQNGFNESFETMGVCYLEA